MSEISLSSVGREAGAGILPDTSRVYNPTVGATATICKLGLWSAVISAICSLAYGAAVIAVMAATLSTVTSSKAQGWTGIEAFLAGFGAVQMLPLFPSLLLVPAFTALMVSIHAWAAEDKKIWSQLGLAFTLIYAAIAASNYLVQLLPVWRGINAGETDGLAMFVLGNPHAMFWGLVYAYLFMNLGMLFSAQAFAGDGLAKRTRWLFILNGATMALTVAAMFVDSPPFYLLGSLVVWCPVFTGATVCAARLFHRQQAI